MIDALLRGAARALRPLVRFWRSEASDPSPAHRALLFAGFFVPFGAWMALRAVLLLLRRPVDVDAEVDLGAPSTWKVRCRLPDMIQMYLYLFGVWEPDLSAFIRRRLGLGDGFIDVGANVGVFTMLAGSCVGRSGRVLAIDASPALAQRLRANLAANAALHPELVAVRVVEAAVSDRAGTLELWSGPLQNLGRTTTVAALGERRVATTRAAPLGDLASDEELRTARLIKIDVEGAEAAVLAGLAPCLPRLRDDVEIMVELSPHWWPAGAAPLSQVLAPYLEAGFLPYELPNNYWPWRYLWPRRVSPPRRIREDPDHLRRRVDLVLSRVDAESL